MPEEQQPQNSDQPAAQESDVTSFRQRAMERLGAEAPGAVAPEEKAIDAGEGDLVDAHQLDTNYPDEELQQQSTEDNDESGVDNTDVEGVLGEQDVTELRQRAEQAETMISSMQTDYTRKTQKLGESRRELLSSLEQSQQLAGVYANRANQAVAQFNGVNWQQLQSTLDPQSYSKRVAEYQQAVQARDREVKAHEQIQTYVKEQTDKHNNEAAEISRDVLRSTVPGWGNDLYQTLREYAVNALDYSQPEFDEITDYRIIKLIHASWNVAGTGSRIENIQHNGSRLQQPNGGPNKKQPRGVDGRFRQAQEKHLANPGNRDLTRDAFRERLQRERRGR